MKFFGLLVVACVLALASVGHARASTCAGAAEKIDVVVPGNPFMAVASADDCWVFVTLGIDGKRGAVAVLRNQDGRFVVDHTVELKGAGLGAALSHDGQVLAVAVDHGAEVLDVAGLEHGAASPLLGELSSGRDAGAVYTAISKDDRLLFVSDEDAHRISVFDLAKARSDGFDRHALIGHIPMANAPVGLALSGDGRWLYATSQNAPLTAHMGATCKSERGDGQMHAPGLLFRIDVDVSMKDPAHALVGAVPAGCNPVRVAVSPSGKQVWVAARGDNALLEFQADDLLSKSGNISRKTFPIGPSPVGVAVRPDGKQVWAALSNRFGKDGGGEIAGLADITDSKPDQRLSMSASGFPREVMFLADGRTMVVTLFRGKQVEFMTLPP